MDNTTKKHSSEYYYITLTDMQLHTQEPRKPLSLLRAFFKSLTSGKKGGRVYSKNIIANEKTGEVFFNLPFVIPTDKIPEGAKQAMREGKKIRLIVPNEFPVSFGKDLIERMKAEKRRLWKSRF